MPLKGHIQGWQTRIPVFSRALKNPKTVLSLDCPVMLQLLISLSSLECPIIKYPMLWNVLLLNLQSSSGVGDQPLSAVCFSWAEIFLDITIKMDTMGP